MIKELPLYAQVRDQIKDGIESGTIKPGPDGVLPAQQTFADQYNVSLITVKRALRDLGEMGLLESRRGKGIVLTSCSGSSGSGRQIDSSARIVHIGVAFFEILNRINNPVVQKLMSGIEAFSREHNIALHIVSFPGLVAGTQEDTLFNDSSFMNLDGVLLLSPVSSNSIATIVKRGIPCISYNLLTDIDIVCHTPDAVMNYFKVTDAVLKRGRRKIAVFAGSKAKVSSYLALSGYKLALEKHGCEFVASRLSHEDYDVDSAVAFVEERIKREKDIDAVIAFDDIMASGIHDFLASVGRSDVLVAGMGNLDGFEDKIKITMDLRLRETCYQATKMLLDMINGLKPKERKYYYEGILVERD